jgi:thymidylate synthase ThyX
MERIPAAVSGNGHGPVNEVRVIREPTVYLLGRQTVNGAELDRFLADHGVSWQTDTEVAAEALTEVAGRVCYMSFARPRPGGNAAYLGHILEVGHGSVLEHAVWNLLFTGVSRALCYDADTEVLTSEGWRRWPDVTGQEEFATLTSEGRLAYERAVKVFSGPYRGPMYRVVSEQIDLMVTPRHRMYVQFYDTQAAKRGQEPYGIKQASEIVHRRVRYKKDALWDAPDRETVALPLTQRTFERVLHEKLIVQSRTYQQAVFAADPFWAFLGYFVSEGFLGSTDTSINLCQNDGTPTAERIRRTLRELGLRYSETANGARGVRFACKNVALRDWLKEHVHCGAEKKRVPRLVGELCPRQIRLFLEAMIDGDGSRRKDGSHTVCYTASKGLADDLQILALKAGWAANVRIDDRTGLERSFVDAGGRSHEFQNQFPSYIVSFCRTRTRPLVNHARHLKTNTGKGGAPRLFGKHDDGFVEYGGQVYCVEVPSGLLYVRRNGKPCWSGNTHELVRHRSGFGYSQLSQRYVDESVAEYVEPEEIASDPQLHALWLDAVGHAHAAYIKLAEGLQEKFKDEPDKTLRRKMARQAARSVLPNATETKIFVTANARALRHFIEMRGSRHAEVEIRKLAVAVLRLMQAEAPNVFGDYRLEPLPDGTYEAVTDHRKV